MKKCQIQASGTFVANHQMAERAQPSDRPLDDPSALVSTELPAVLGGGLDSILAMRADQIDAPTREFIPKRVAVIGTVGNEAWRILSWATATWSGNGNGLQRLRDEPDFRR